MPFIPSEDVYPATLLEMMEKNIAGKNIQEYPRSIIRDLMLWKMIYDEKNSETGMSVHDIVAKILSDAQMYKLFRVDLYDEDQDFDANGYANRENIKISSELNKFLFQYLVEKYYPELLSEQNVVMSEKQTAHLTSELEKLVDSIRRREFAVPREYFNEWRPTVNRMIRILKLKVDHIPDNDRQKVLKIDRMIKEVLGLRKREVRGFRSVRVVDENGREAEFDSVFNVEERRFVILEEPGIWSFKRQLAIYKRILPIVKAFPDWKKIIKIVTNGNFIKSISKFQQSILPPEIKAFNFCTRIITTMTMYCLSLNNVPFDDNSIKALSQLCGFRVSKNPPGIKRYDMKGLTQDPFTEVIVEEVWRARFAKKIVVNGTEEDAYEVSEENFNEEFIPLYEDVQSFNEDGTFRAKVDMQDIPLGDARQSRRIYDPKDYYFMTTSGAAATKKVISIFLECSAVYEHHLPS